MYTRRMESTSTPWSTPPSPATPDVVTYPFFRKVILILIIGLAVAALLFLLYSNGKSIYDNGI